MNCSIKTGFSLSAVNWQPLVSIKRFFQLVSFSLALAASNLTVSTFATSALAISTLAISTAAMADTAATNNSNASDSKEIQSFESEQQRQLYLKLTAELRCPQCQNQNIADSNAVVAVDMREKTYELVQQGYSRNQVLDYMIDRYGDFVHYQPPVNRVTVWLWLAPGLLLISLLLVQLKRRANPQSYPHNSGTNALPGESYPHDSGTEPAKADAKAKAQLNQQLDNIIEQYRSKKP